LGFAQCVGIQSAGFESGVWCIGEATKRAAGLDLCGSDEPFDFIVGKLSADVVRTANSNGQGSQNCQHSGYLEE
jgi:hypothetical protein